MFDKLHVMHIISFIHLVSNILFVIFPLNFVEVYLSINLFIDLFNYRIKHFIHLTFEHNI